MIFATATDGTRLAYEITGAGDPVLLISGQSLDRSMWDATAPLLAKSFTVIRFDARGTGASDKPRTPYSTRIFAADAVAVLDAAGIARSHVYGFSMGGRVAQYIAIDHPNRVGCADPGRQPGRAVPHAIPKPPANIDAALIRGPRSVLAEGLLFAPAYLIAHPDAFAPPAYPSHTPATCISPPARAT